MVNKNLLWLVLALVLGGCPGWDFGESPEFNDEPVTNYEPLYLSRSDLETSITFEPAPREINRPGKMYLLNNILYISEKYEGVHILDNSNPENPQKLGFIKVPGCMDIAAKGNILYVDNAVDLVVIELSTPTTIRVVNRLRNYFPEIVPPDLSYVPFPFYEGSGERPRDSVIVGWKKHRR